MPAESARLCLRMFLSVCLLFVCLLVPVSSNALWRFTFLSVSDSECLCFCQFASACVCVRVSLSASLSVSLCVRVLLTGFLLSIKNSGLTSRSVSVDAESI